MATICALCGKQPNRRVWRLVKLRGKYNPTFKRTQKPNLQWLRLSPLAAGKLHMNPGQRIKACTKCIKALGKSK